MQLEIKKIGNSTGLILPKDLLAHLNLKQGDTVHITEMPGGIRLTPANPRFEAAMAAVDDVMDEYRDTLAELAK